MEEAQNSPIDYYIKRISTLIASQSPSEIKEFLYRLEKEMNSYKFQIDVYNNADSYLALFVDLAKSLLSVYPDIYLALEKIILNYLNHSSYVLSNFSLIVLIEISSIIPAPRASQLTDYFLSGLSGTTEKQYTRYLSQGSDLLYSYTYLVKEKKYDAIVLLADLGCPDPKVFEYIKTVLSSDSPAEVHYVLIKLSGNSDIRSYFKNFASKMWVLSNTQKLTNIECLTLLEYSCLPCIRSEIQDLDILKSVIFSLHMSFEFLRANIDQKFAFRAKDLIQTIDSIEVNEKYRKKVKENVEKVWNKILSDYTFQKKVSQMEQNEISQFCTKLCTKKLDIVEPIIQIQQILGLKFDWNTENTLMSTVKALEEITNYIKTIKS